MVAVLAGAALHASWNVAIRFGGDRRRETALLAATAALLAAATLPLLRQPLRRRGRTWRSRWGCTASISH